MYKRFLYITLTSVLCLQFLNIPIAGTHIKPYMLVTVILIALLVFVKKFKIFQFYPYEVFWLLTYALTFVSITYASDSQLAIQLVLGQIILVSFFILFRILLVRTTGIDDMLFKCFSFFIYISIAFYIIGCLQVFVLGNSTVFYQQLNEHSYRVWGCYFEGDVFPRLMGVSESPNNFAYFGITILWWSIWKKKSVLAYCSLIALALTLSTSTVVVLCVQIMILVIIKRSINWKYLISLIIIFSAGYYIFADNEFVQNMIEIRMARNATGSGRFGLWDITNQYIEKRPLLGYGANQFRVVMSRTGYMSAHNNILETLFSTGIVGCLFYLCFLLSFLVYSIRLTQKSGSMFFLLMGLAFILYGMSNNTLTIEFTPFILAFYYYYGYYYFHLTQVNHIKRYLHEFKKIQNTGNSTGN